MGRQELLKNVIQSSELRFDYASAEFRGSVHEYLVQLCKICLGPDDMSHEAAGNLARNSATNAAISV